MATDKPRIFLGSSGKQTKLIEALTRGLEEIAHPSLGRGPPRHAS